MVEDLFGFILELISLAALVDPAVSKNDGSATKPMIPTMIEPIKTLIRFVKLGPRFLECECHPISRLRYRARQKNDFLRSFNESKKHAFTSGFWYRPVNTWEKVLVLVPGGSPRAIFRHNREQFSSTVSEKLNSTINLSAF